MNENRLPPGYVPLTIHEINGQSAKQNAPRRSDGDRQRRNGRNDRNDRNAGPRGGGGRINKRRPRNDEFRSDENEPNEE